MLTLQNICSHRSELMYIIYVYKNIYIDLSKMGENSCSDEIIWHALLCAKFEMHVTLKKSY